MGKELRIVLLTGVAGGGMLAAAFLSTAVATADIVGDTGPEAGTAEVDSFANDSGSETGLFDGLFSGLDEGMASDAGLTIDHATLTPVGDTSVSPDIDAGPLFSTGSTSDAFFGVTDEYGDTVGNVGGDEAVSSFLGVDNTDFTVDSANATETAASATDIQSALASAELADSDFSGDDSSLGDVAGALADWDSTDVLAGQVSTAEVSDALDNADINTSDDTSTSDIADALNTAETGAGDSSDLPADGTQYSITNFGLGFANVYEAAPSGDGGTDTTDVLVTPLGNIDLPIDSDLFGSDFTSFASDLLGPSGLDASGLDLFGSSVLDASDAFDQGINADDFLGGISDQLENLTNMIDSTSANEDVSADDIQSAISEVLDSDLQHLQDADFTGEHSSLSDVADALADSDSTNILGGNVSGDAVINALHDAGISIHDDDVSASEIADRLNAFSGEGGLTLLNLFDDAGSSEAGDGLGDILSSLF